MALPTDAGNGANNHVAAAHVWIQGDNSDSSMSFGEVMASSTTADKFAYLGLLQVATTNLTSTVNKVKAENSKGAIKNSNSDFVFEVDVEAMIGTAQVLSAGHAYLPVGKWLLDTAVPDGKQDLHVQAKILYLRDNYPWKVAEGVELVHDGGYWIKRMLLTGMGISLSADGSGRKVWKFKLTEEKDSAGDSYTVIIPGIITPTADNYL